MLTGIISAIILQNFVYSNMFVKCFNQVVKFDGCHFLQNPDNPNELLDINSEQSNLKNNDELAKNSNQKNLNNDEIKHNNIELGNIGASRKKL